MAEDTARGVEVHVTDADGDDVALSVTDPGQALDVQVLSRFVLYVPPARRERTGHHRARRRRRHASGRVHDPRRRDRGE
jgi:hypothetical protein